MRQEKSLNYPAPLSDLPEFLILDTLGLSGRNGDEMEYLGEGFNRMAEQLGETIQEVYVAQICQRTTS